MLLPGKHTRSETAIAEKSVKVRKFREIRCFAPVYTQIPPQNVWRAHTPSRSSLANSALSEMKAKARLGLGAHQPFDRIGGALAVVGQQHHAQHGALGRVHGGFLQLRRRGIEFFGGGGGGGAPRQNNRGERGGGFLSFVGDN